ncbi:16S rRNA (cytidine(1402)-2'-O)-methyltransferase [Congregibacter litoralis]|uniref:Ribosomal RNA small subunit methyltransferase I n=1 Tax=Congregibacter litoralis KT71 TaxID=314285 RepID=A4A5F0_9GAMM|nr:16S rRNA (cytidine(1402)-2'-O)-methyltransferase [Congregibacter litoralis]EAQ99021.1 putative S-adenosylmethionine-dependent methyltransferase, YraL family [Congregibacter litoralis KT71]
MEPALYIVATPIGNLGDISRRAVEVLSQVSCIAAEDTRRTGQLLSGEGIKTRMLAYHEHSAPQVAEQLAARVAAGESVALVSDAGTPTISDPGYRLVRVMQDEGLKVIPLPGPCAAVVGLSGSGLPSDRFAFEGFLPNRGEARRRRLEALASSDATLIFYEAPHRILATLEDLQAVMGGSREAALARELTKSFETIRRASLSELCEWVRDDANQARGEIVLLLAPAPDQGVAEVDSALGELLRGMAEHMPARQAAKLVAAYAGMPSRQLYDYLLQHKEG